MSVPIEFSEVGLDYPTREGTRAVLSGINLSVRSAETLALVGRSGSGKTTLLNIAAGLLTPTHGRVTFGASTEAQPRVGYVFQDARLLPWLTLEANLKLVCPPEFHADIPQALARVGLKGRGKDFPGQLSLGMAQRAAVARALVIRPDVLLLDEPSGALDELTASELRGELAGLLQVQPATTLLVTHHPTEAVQMADRIAVLGGQPATLAGMIEVPLPHPRDPDDPALLACVRELRQHLRQEAVAGP